MGFLRPKAKPGSKTRPDINVTPLVDVVLVLLIIFMVVAPELEHGVRVDLPGVGNPDPGVDTGDEQNITLTVGADGSVFLEDERVATADLAAKLEALKKADPTRRVRLKGDERRPYGEMRDLFKQVQTAGFTGVKLLVGARDVSGAAASHAPPPRGD